MNIYVLLPVNNTNFQYPFKMKSAATVAKKPFANLSMEQVRKDMAAAEKAGRSPFAIDFAEATRSSGDDSVTYYNLYWLTAEGKMVIPIIEFKYNFICATKPLEDRKSMKVKKPQLIIMKRKVRDGMDDRDIKKVDTDAETYATLLKLSKEAESYINKCIDDGKMEEHKMGVSSNAQYDLSRSTKKSNSDAKMDDPIIRYEFKVSGKVMTEFFDDDEKNYNPTTKRFDYTDKSKNNSVTDDNIHTFFTAESYCRVQLAYSVSMSQFGYSAKAFVKRVYYRTNNRPRNLQSIEATDDDREEFEEYKRMKAEMAKLKVSNASLDDDINSALGYDFDDSHE